MNKVIMCAIFQGSNCCISVTVHLCIYNFDFSTYDFGYINFMTLDSVTMCFCLFCFSELITVLDSDY